MIKATCIDHMGTDLSVVNAARVSFGKQSQWESAKESVEIEVDGETWVCDDDIRRLSDKDTKLVRYLAKHKHYSPFGHCFASFHIKAPIFVARQLVKHEYLRMNEISRRYVDSRPEFYVPKVWRGRSKDKKQGSDGVVEGVWGLDVGTGGLKVDKYGKVTYPIEGVTTCTMNFMEAQIDLYTQLVEHGVAPEMARMVLPQSVYTEWYWSGSMDAFANMCNLRLKEDTQYETRLVAQQIDRVMGKLYPVSWKALVHEQA